MSSPSRPLSPRKDSLINSRSSSPSKSKSPQAPPPNPFLHSLVKLPQLGFTMTPKRSGRSSASPSFTIYEDKPEEHAQYHHAEPQDAESAFDDKENILQPKGLASTGGRSGFRAPLAALSIAEYPGYIATEARGPARRLQHVYQPKNYNNESRTLHKFNHLPSFITPPRNAMKKILYQSFNAEDDDVERRLVAKLRQLMRRKRAMSVGVNRGKAHLVAKNTFNIVSS